MTFASQLTAKQMRSIRRDIDLIFSKKGSTEPKTIEEFKLLGLFPPKLRYKDRDIYLSSRGVESLRRITSFIYQTDKYSVLVDFNDVFQSVQKELENWLSKKLVPDEHEFLSLLNERLEKKIDSFTYLCKVDGIKLKEVKKLEIGKKAIEPYSSALVKHAKFSSDDIVKIIDEEYEDSFVITGEEKASSTVSLSKFYFHCESYLSLLRMYACAIYKTAIKKTKISLVNDCSVAWGPASTIGWHYSNGDGVFTRYFKSTQDLEFDNELIGYLHETCFFNEAASLIEKQGRNELEDSIVKAIRWFGEAQNDRFDASKWIKLWTCLECFFTLNSTEITEANARGIASLLLYGGYGIDDFGDYTSLKSKIKSFYSSRSKIIHNADYAHVDEKSLNELAYMVAWVIITVVSLLPKGYSTRIEIKQQADRLDNLTIKSSGRKKLRR